MTEKAKKPVALITGVGPGTGSSLVRRFAKGGYRVAMMARDRDRLKALEDEIPGAFAVPCDVADAAALKEAVEKIDAPKVLVHNAVGGHSGRSSISTRRSCNVTSTSTRWRYCISLGLSRRPWLRLEKGQLSSPATLRLCGERRRSLASLPPGPPSGSSQSRWPENWARKASTSPIL